jgi:hypothetical protein
MSIGDLITRAAFGLALSTTEERDPFAEATAPLGNHWHKADGDKSVEWIDEEAEEKLLYGSPVETIKTLFPAPTPERVAPNLGTLPPLPPEPDDEEREYFAAIAPIDKLFHPTVASVEASNFNKREATPAIASAADAPLEKATMSRREAALREYFQRAKEQDADFGPEDYAQIAEEDGDVEQAALLRRIAKTL